MNQQHAPRLDCEAMPAFCSAMVRNTGPLPHPEIRNAGSAA